MTWANRISFFRLFILFAMPFCYVEGDWSLLFALGMGVIAYLYLGLDAALLRALNLLHRGWDWRLGWAGVVFVGAYAFGPFFNGFRPLFGFWLFVLV